MENKSQELKEKASHLKEKALDLKEQYEHSHLGLPYVQKLVQDGVEWFDKRRETFTKKFEQVSVYNVVDGRNPT